MIVENVTFLVDLSMDVCVCVWWGEVVCLIFSAPYHFKIKMIVSFNLNRSEDRFDIICKSISLAFKVDVIFLSNNY